jgi:hypothetical protein
MNENNPQFKSQNGSTYVFNLTEKQWYKFCPADELPADVRIQIREAKNEADLILSLPLD